MKRILPTALIAGSLLCASAQAADVGVSISVGEPGFYGRIDIGDYPQPQVLWPQPVLIERVSVRRAPVYLHVPPGHAKHWSKYCYRYGACGERVYFVKDDWYDRVYVPSYRERHGHRHDDYDHDRDRGRSHRDRNDRHDNGRHGRHDD